MAEIYLNKDNLEIIIKSYSDVEESFILRSLIPKDDKIICNFYINGKDCIVNIYIKKSKNTIKLLPIGKNIEESKKLIDYIVERGYPTDIETKQFSFNCKNDDVKLLLAYMEEDCKEIIETTKVADNTYKFKGYNGDILTFTFYKNSNRALIQGRPFQAYSVVMAYLSELPDYSFEDIVNINNGFAGLNTPVEAIRLEMKQRLGDSYNFLPMALLKSISGSISLIKQTVQSEDYTGCVVGAFKGLEGYLKEILVKKYSFRLTRRDTFSMFYKGNGKDSEIDLMENVDTDAKIWLNSLYNIYKDKRNVFLHTTINSEFTRIIETIGEAEELVYDIMNTIKCSYNIIF